MECCRRRRKIRIAEIRLYLHCQIRQLKILHGALQSIRNSLREDGKSQFLKLNLKHWIELYQPDAPARISKRLRQCVLFVRNDPTGECYHSSWNPQSHQQHRREISWYILSSHPTPFSLSGPRITVAVLNPSPRQPLHATSEPITVR